MALKPCKACGKETTTYVDVCRHCGAKNPTDGEGKQEKQYGIGYVIFVVMIGLSILYALRHRDRTPEQEPKFAQRVYDQSKLRKALRDWIDRDNDEIDAMFSLSVHEMAGIEPGYKHLPIEPDFTIPKDTSHYLTQLYAQFAKRSGYVCDSISAAQNKVGDIRIWCNGWELRIPLH